MLTENDVLSYTEQKFAKALGYYRNPDKNNMSVRVLKALRYVYEHEEDVKRRADEEFYGAESVAEMVMLIDHLIDNAGIPA